MRLIDADALIAELSNPKYCGYDDAIMMLQDAPTVEVCSDVISRQAAIEKIEPVLTHGQAIECQRIINRLPAAQTEQRWIPTSERVPEETGYYLVWMQWAPPECRVAVSEWRDGYWAIKTPISAWCPLPEAYQGETT